MAEAIAGDGLRERTLHGLAWSALGNAFLYVARFAVAIVLARLLAPDDFGLVAMAVAVVGFLQVLTREGFDAALVHRPEADDAALSTAFWGGLALGSALACLGVGAAPQVAAFYGEPAVAALVRLLSLHFLFDSLGLVPRALLRRSLDFRAITLVEGSAHAAAGLAAIALALAGFGIWSLAAQSLLAAALASTAIWRRTRWRPRARPDAAALRELVAYSRSVWASNTLSYAVRNLDDVLIGRFLGPVALGLYGRAYRLMLLPLRTVSDTSTQVMFPSLSTLRGDRERVRGIYLRMVAAISTVTAPLAVGLFVVADDLVLALLGSAWAGCIPLVRILSLLGLTQSVLSTVGVVYRSQGRPDLELRVGLVLKAVLVAGIVAGLPWGVTGVAAGYAAASLVNSVPCAWFPGRLIGVTLGDFARAVRGPVACALLMGAAVFAGRQLLPAGWLPIARLPLEIAGGAAVYAGLVLAFRLPAAREIVELWRRRSARR